MSKAMLKTVPQAERFKAALTQWGIFIALALVSVFIPVAHFVLVPLFVLLSFVFAYLGYQKKYRFEADSVECIHCKETFSVNASFSELSVRVDCTSCGSQNSIKLDELAPS